MPDDNPSREIARFSISSFRKSQAAHIVRGGAGFENLAKQHAFRGVRPNVRASDRGKISLGGAHDPHAANGKALGSQLGE